MAKNNNTLFYIIGAVLVLSFFNGNLSGNYVFTGQKVNYQKFTCVGPELFIGDLNCNGELDQDDVAILDRVVNGRDKVDSQRVRQYMITQWDNEVNEFDVIALQEAVNSGRNLGTVNVGRNLIIGP